MVAYLQLTAYADGRVQGDGAVGDLGVAGKEHPGDPYVRLAVEYLRQGQTEMALRKTGNAVLRTPTTQRPLAWGRRALHSQCLRQFLNATGVNLHKPNLSIRRPWPIRVMLPPES